MDLAAFAWLRSPAGTAALEFLARAGPLDDAAALVLGSRLRARHPPELAAAAMTQARLRQRATGKFGAAAATMWFTAAGLEQATHPLVAGHRAARLTAALPTGTAVLDLCCGIGSDLGALARAGLAVTGVEADPLTAALAAANAGALAATVEVGDATARALGDAAVFVDPARRTARGRVFDPSAYSPPWSFVSEVLARRAGAAKVAPGIPHGLVPPGAEAEWVSVRGEVKEAALYSPALATGRRRATLLPGGHTLAATDDADDESPVPVGEVGRRLYEPDGAVIRAHLVGAVAELLGGRLLDPTIAYITADTDAGTPFATAYEVTDVLPFAVRPLRALLRERGVGVLTVKKRGSGIVPERLRRELLRGSRGSAEATLIVTRRAGAPTALLVRPVR